MSRNKQLHAIVKGFVQGVVRGWDANSVPTLEAHVLGVHARVGGGWVDVDVRGHPALGQERGLEVLVGAGLGFETPVDGLGACASHGDILTGDVHLAHVGERVGQALALVGPPGLRGAVTDC